MTRFALVAILALTATSAAADMGAFLPDLTFPSAPSAPTVSTQGCLPLITCPVSQ